MTVVSAILGIVLVGIVGVAAYVILPIATEYFEQIYVENYEHSMVKLVEAAEQMIGSGGGAEKLDLVKRWLTERGMKANIPAIEAAVYRLKPPNETAGGAE
jgi:hypothetical protein